jgi:hypothetical protein
MTNQILSFEEMLEREEYVLVDTSVHESVSGWFKEGIYPVSSFSGIDEELLISKRDGLKYFVSFLEEPRTYTSQGVSLELEKARNMVEFKISRLERLTYGPPRKKSKGRKREQNRKFLREIRDLFYQSSLQARKSILKPENKDLYSLLENFVFKVSEHTNAKKDFSYRYKGYQGGNKEELHTDEQLVSLALYLSVQGNESCIVTRDSDLRRILLNSVRYLSDSRVSSQDCLLDSIKGNRIKVYYNSSLRMGELTFDTSEFELWNELSQEEIEGVEQAL